MFRSTIRCAEPSAFERNVTQRVYESQRQWCLELLVARIHICVGNESGNRPEKVALDNVMLVDVPPRFLAGQRADSLDHISNSRADEL